MLANPSSPEGEVNGCNSRNFGVDAFAWRFRLRGGGIREEKIWEDILNAYAAHDTIDFAYRTQRLYRKDSIEKPDKKRFNIVKSVFYNLVIVTKMEMVQVSQQLAFQEFQLPLLLLAYQFL